MTAAEKAQLGINPRLNYTVDAAGKPTLVPNPRVFQPEEKAMVNGLEADAQQAEGLADTSNEWMRIYDSIPQTGIGVGPLQVFGNAGTGGQYTLPWGVGKAFKSIGEAVTPQLKTLEAMSTKLAVGMRPKGSKLTQSEIPIYTRASMSINSPPSANRDYQAYQNRAASFSRLKADFYNKFLNSGGDLQGAGAAWNRVKPQFGQLPHPTNAQDAALLPSGTKYIAADGRKATVP